MAVVIINDISTPLDSVGLFKDSENDEFKDLIDKYLEDFESETNIDLFDAKLYIESKIDLFSPVIGAVYVSESSKPIIQVNLKSFDSW